MSARKNDTPVCECGHADTGHNRQRRGMFTGYGSCMRTNGRRGHLWRPCPCLRFRVAGGAR